MYASIGSSSGPTPRGHTCHRKVPSLPCPGAPSVVWVRSLVGQAPRFPAQSRWAVGTQRHRTLSQWAAGVQSITLVSDAPWPPGSPLPLRVQVTAPRLTDFPPKKSVASRRCSPASPTTTEGGFDPQNRPSSRVDPRTPNSRFQNRFPAGVHLPGRETPGSEAYKSKTLYGTLGTSKSKAPNDDLGQNLSNFSIA